MNTHTAGVEEYRYDTLVLLPNRVVRLANIAVDADIGLKIHYAANLLFLLGPDLIVCQWLAEWHANGEDMHDYPYLSTKPRNDGTLQCDLRQYYHLIATLSH